MWQRRFGGVQHQLQQHQQKQQQQQAQQLKSLCFYQNREGTSSLGATCFWRSFRPSVAACFGVAKGAFWRLAAPPAAVAAAAAAAAGPAGPAAEFALFLPESRRDVKPRGNMFLEALRPSGPWCFTVRKRPLELRCGAVLRVWELHFGAGFFLSVQKATLGSGACFLGAVSVLQCHGVLLFRDRPLEVRWELFRGHGGCTCCFGIGRHRFKHQIRAPHFSTGVSCKGDRCYLYAAFECGHQVLLIQPWCCMWDKHANRIGTPHQLQLEIADRSVSERRLSR